MIKLKDLVPTNLASEKEKFFAKQGNYNPQFQYQKQIPALALNFMGKLNGVIVVWLKKLLIKLYKKSF
jgi:hypothetical protein